VELLDKSECTFKLFDGRKDVIIIRGGAHGNCAKTVLLHFLAAW